jgi:fumarate reductase flavoprotein subunit
MAWTRAMKTNDVTEKSGIVIAGAGGAGLAAALAAVESGASSVTVLEKRRFPGGTSSLASGIFACESPVQARLKIVADRDALFRKAMDWAHWEKVDPKILRAFINRSGDTIRWLENKGLRFEVIRFYPDQVPLVQHNIVGTGARLVKVLAQQCRRRGVDILLNATATRIIIDKKGRVGAVRFIQGGEEKELPALGVVIATGGFAGNPGLLKKLCPAYRENLVLSGLPLEGDGLALAAGAGAALADFATVLKEGPRLDRRRWPLMHFERDPSALWVNRRGERFIDETAGYHVFEAVNGMLAQSGGIAYALFDADIKQLFEEKMPGIDAALRAEAGKGRVHVAETWQDMAAWLGADPGVLEKTVARYNDLCDRGYDEDLGKDRRYLRPLRRPPYYAIKGIATILDTIGGVVINERMEALDTGKRPIPGLYAAGVITSGWESDVYCSELSASAFGFAVNSGRIAGENAAAYVMSTERKGRP